MNSYSWGTSGLSGGQKVSGILRNTKDHYRVQNSLSLNPILSQMTPIPDST